MHLPLPILIKIDRDYLLYFKSHETEKNIYAYAIDNEAIT